MTQTLNDQELLRDYVDRNAESALQALIQRHVNLVFSTSVRIVTDRQAAEEVAQNVFMALARKAVWLRGERNLAPWLHRSAVLEARRWLRGECRRRRHEEAAIEMGTTMNDDSSALKPLIETLDDTLLELRETDRQALLLRYFEERSHREIAALLGIGEDASRKRVDKALENLTRFFRQRGYSVPAIATTAAALRAASQIAPAGLATSAGKAAMVASGAGTLGGFGSLLGKCMALTKTQVVGACILIAAAPIGYQSHTLAGARAEHAALKQQLSSLRADVSAELQAADILGNRLADMERRLIAAQMSPVPPQPQSLFVWDSHSEYVRLPKAILSKIQLTGGEVTTRADGTKRAWRSGVLSEREIDLLPSAALLDALGSTPDEREVITTALRDFGRDFEALARARSQVTNSSAGGTMGPRTLTRVTPAMLEEGTALRERLENSILTALGPERAAVFWQATEGALKQVSADFGSATRLEIMTGDINPVKLLHLDALGKTRWEANINMPERLKMILAEFASMTNATNGRP